MVKITFMGAGSSVFAKNVLGDSMLTPALHDAEIQGRKLRVNEARNKAV